MWVSVVLLDFNLGAEGEKGGTGSYVLSNKPCWLCSREWVEDRVTPREPFNSPEERR
jgi:hypothetical protein